jgi:type I restriction enzyme S subunit
MSDALPEDWSIKPLGELAQVVSGGTPSRNVPYFWDDGKIPWITPTDITATRGKYISDSNDKITKLGLMGCSASLLPSGSILMTSRATLGEAKISTMPACTNQGFKSLVPKSGVSNEFLYYQIQRTKQQYARFGSGSTFLEVGKKDTDAFPVMIPDADRQAKIAELLSLLDTQIEATEALIAKQERVRAGLKQDLFTRGVDEHGQLRPPRDQGPRRYHQTELGWLPLAWEVGPITRCINSASDATIGPFGSNLVATHYRAAGVPVIFVRDVKPDRFLWKSDVFVDPAKARDLAAHGSRPGDVIATKMGFPPCIACLHPHDFPAAIITADMIRLRVSRRDIAIPEYISGALNSEAVLAQVRAITGGVTRPKITLADFRSLRVAYPPVDEQKLIFDRLALIDGLIDDLLSEVAKLNLQKSGLMQDLLTGKVSVAPLLESAAA